MQDHPKPFLLDSNVLIDYLNSDFGIVRSASDLIAPVSIIMPVFDEVKRLDLDICVKYGITVISPIIAYVDDFDLKYKSLSEVD